MALFKAKYFNLDAKKDLDAQFNAEIEWLFQDIQNEHDLYKRIYPFWSQQFTQKMLNFMESTEQIQGNYELKEAEFGQLKHSLNVNDEIANTLFQIIRLKHRALSWKQLYGYLTFILNMKYNVQTAILESKQAEDTTVSIDGMKISLKISLNDESKWLFDKVLSLNASKVTWKQIRNYLEKVVAVRQEIRDFFEDQERERNYDEKKAEIIDDLTKSVKNGNDEMVNLLESIETSTEICTNLTYFDFIKNDT